VKYLFAEQNNGAIIKGTIRLFDSLPEACCHIEQKRLKGYSLFYNPDKAGNYFNDSYTSYELYIKQHSTHFIVYEFANTGCNHAGTKVKDKELLEYKPIKRGT